MLGGEIYVGFPFAEQFYRLAVFIFAKLINTVLLILLEPFNYSMKN